MPWPSLDVKAFDSDNTKDSLPIPQQVAKRSHLCICKIHALIHFQIFKLPISMQKTSLMSNPVFLIVIRRHFLNLKREVGDLRIA